MATLESGSASRSRSAYAASLRRIARAIKSSLGSRVVVLLYHRIAHDPLDPHKLCVAPERFDEQVAAAREFGPVLSLGQLGTALVARKLPRRASVITFDDGFIDNLTVAKPILEKHDVPATFFITHGNVGRQREMWWDELEQLLIEPGTLPSSLAIELNGQHHTWSLEGVTDYPPDAAHRHASWRVPYRLDDPHYPTPRHRAYTEIFHLVWPFTHTQRQMVLDDLQQQAGRTVRVRADHRLVSDDELARLGAGPLVEIGAHTMTHANLPSHTDAEQHQEIAGNKARLEAIVGRPVESFAYPYGLHTSRTVELVREAGYQRACACMGHAVRNSSEMHRLTRTELGDLDGDAFARALREAVAN